MNDFEQVKYLSSPIFTWWDITNRCNLNCLHCYSKSSANNFHEEELTTQEAKNLICQLAQAGVFYIYFLGGEPFLRTDFFDIIEFARSKSISVMINTNGWFIDRNKAKELRRLGVNEVKVSIDGIDSDTHDSFRGKDGSFERALNALIALVDAGLPRASVVTTVTKRNLKQVPWIVDLAAKHKAFSIQNVPLSRTGRGEGIYTDLSITTEENIWLSNILKDKKHKYQNELTVYSVDGVMDGNCTACVKMGKVTPDFMGCRAGRLACNIDFNGNVIPCLLVREPIAGNIRDKGFISIWNDSDVFKLWRAKHTKHPECRSCKWSGLCIRECPLSPSQQVVGQEVRSQNVAERDRAAKPCKAIVDCDCC